ncbi:unnamed protein product, partial [Ixodes persulcatus]
MVSSRDGMTRIIKWERYVKEARKSEAIVLYNQHRQSRQSDVTLMSVYESRKIRPLSSILTKTIKSPYSPPPPPLSLKKGSADAHSVPSSLAKDELLRLGSH